MDQKPVPDDVINPDDFVFVVVAPASSAGSFSPLAVSSADMTRKYSLDCVVRLA